MAPTFTLKSLAAAALVGLAAAEDVLYSSRMSKRFIDSAGNYKTVGPTTAMKMSVTGGLKSDADDEADQEKQVIDLYGKENGHWDQAGKF